jgi:hypothetical protein
MASANSRSKRANGHILGRDRMETISAVEGMETDIA